MTRVEIQFPAERERGAEYSVGEGRKNHVFRLVSGKLRVKHSLLSPRPPLFSMLSRGGPQFRQCLPAVRGPGLCVVRSLSYPNSSAYRHNATSDGVYMYIGNI